MKKLMKTFKLLVAILSVSMLTSSCSGDDDDAQAPIPTPIVVPQQLYTKITSGDFHSLAIKNDGTLWSWGANGFGQLGYSTATTSGVKLPSQIGTSTWTSIASGSLFNLGIKTDGTLWGWGSNEFGQLGDAIVGNKTVPTQIGTATNWKTIAAGQYHTLAIKTDGTLWVCGINSLYELGDGTLTNKTTLTQIGTATNWKEIAAGNTFSIAIKTNGTLWKWGTLQGVTMTPTQIGTATNWKYISAGENQALAIKTDNTLWVWGNNSNGQLGDGTTTNRVDPIQLGTATWKTASSGKKTTLAIKSGVKVSVDKSIKNYFRPHLPFRPFPS